MKKLVDHVQRHAGKALETTIDAAETVTDTTFGVAKGTVTALTLYVPPYIQLYGFGRKVLEPSEGEKPAAYFAAKTVHYVGKAAQTILHSQT